ncbi:glycoside hydrolase family 3 N-terminal domain-containing protein [Oryzobacter telluris]|uniref:glycoside hydrolase family 3 protein n=1 Tax=Oryzobacter telluris TaxID=3149179 RepID=UPI00370D4B9F
MTTTDPGVAADVAATLQPGFAGSTVPAWVERAHAGGLVSLCLYGDNVTAGAGLGALTADLHARLPGVLLATDEEGGDVTRVHYPGGSTVPGNAVLGRLDDPALTRRTAAAIGAELAALGIGLDLAPSVDVNSSPENPVIGVRSFGDDATRVARHSAAFVGGLQGAGVAACAKHFPGHGDTVVDSHHGLPRVDVPLDVLRERELVPFRAAVEAGVRTVMTSHIIVAALDAERPATFSPTVVRVLRDELGFDGVLVSDALDMAGASAGTGIPEAAVRALAAGVDLLCLGSNTSELRYAAVHDAVVDAVGSGRLPRERVAEAAARVRALASDVARPPLGGEPPDAPLDTSTIASAFRLSDTAVRWLAATGPVAVVQVGSVANLAVGDVSWGPAGLGAAVAEADVHAGDRVAVVGRAIGNDHPAHATAERLRATGHDVLLVECGWPRSGADLEVFGGSPAVARALLAVLRGEVTP